jgi:hypothetical protein
MQNLLLKHPMSLCKSCRGGEIYNFGTNTLMHFSYKISRKTWSNEAAPKHCLAGTRLSARRHPGAPRRLRHRTRKPRRPPDRRSTCRASRDVGEPKPLPRVAPSLAGRPHRHSSAGPTVPLCHAHLPRSGRRTTAYSLIR